jgi:hypothetical protein
MDRTPGPQTFAPAVPGTEALDPALVARSHLIETTLLREAESLRQRGDFRWFFTSAHAQITRLINKNIRSFQRPNALMRLNISFAEQFVRALWGQPHTSWRRAFSTCMALQNNAETNHLLVGEVEFCGAAMANVHIHIDLTDAINTVGCIPPEDYGNMLVFVNQGALTAAVALRGRAIGALEMMLQQLIAPMVDLEVKAWRNAAYRDICQIPVPDPNPAFRPRL